ncbi:hypothetical protein LWI28_009187 [Acer negundo]|uniref:Uncharacterized protein n=1 Tax=Acer negundo TaxID=4023 RepID=A0AAD5JAD3_ACENE|nr:hypothetical protein LWI28_009187 [Acer negundo]
MSKPRPGTGPEPDTNTVRVRRRDLHSTIPIIFFYSSKMKYVQPYALFKQMEKLNLELAKRKAIRAQLLGFNILEDYVTVAISDTAMSRVEHYGYVICYAL